MATSADAEIIMKLYDLRREAVCRQARKFLAGWMPTSAVEAQAVTNDGSRQDNAWYRQAITYWEMAFSFANTGALDRDLLAHNCGEGILFAMKSQHLAKLYPQANVRAMKQAETFIASNEIAKQKAEMFRSRFA